MAFFEDTWHYAGRIMLCRSSAGFNTTGTTHIEKAIDDTWPHVTGNEIMQGDKPQTFHFALYLGYDPVLKSYVSLGVGGAGIYGTQYSKGWSGDTFVLSRSKYLARDTFVKKDKNAFRHTGDAQGKDKRWTKVQDEICRRVQ